MGWTDFHLQDPIWFNKNVRLKSKKFRFYPVWGEKRIHSISDLFIGYNLVKLFEMLVVEFDIPISDRRKNNFLMKGICLDWFQNPNNIQENVFNKILTFLINQSKVPKHVYSILSFFKKSNIRPNNIFYSFFLYDILMYKVKVFWSMVGFGGPWMYVFLPLHQTLYRFNKIGGKSIKKFLSSAWAWYEQWKYLEYAFFKLWFWQLVLNPHFTTTLEVT